MNSGPNQLIGHVVVPVINGELMWHFVLITRIRKSVCVCVCCGWVVGGLWVGAQLHNFLNTHKTDQVAFCLSECSCVELRPEAAFK